MGDATPARTGDTKPLSRIAAWARAVKRDVVALWIAARDPRTPWYAKLLAGLVAAYALSPIDLIPDAIPVLGLLDDLILVPLGIVATVALIPPPLMQEFRRDADARAERPTSRTAMVVIVGLWIAAGVASAIGIAALVSE